MKPIPFMYIIRSDDRSNGTANNSYFRLNGLPTKYKQFKVEVVSFYKNFVANDTALYELRTDLPLSNGYDTAFKRLTCIGTTATICASSFEFMVENFNGRTVNFVIFDNDDLNNNIVEDWVLYLKMTGIEQ